MRASDWPVKPWLPTSTGLQRTFQPSLGHSDTISLFGPLAFIGVLHSIFPGDSELDQNHFLDVSDVNSYVWAE